MTLEEQLRAAILEKYKSVRAFTNACGFPYTTVDSVLKRGIMNAGVETVLKIFDALDLDVESVMGGTLRKREKPKTDAPYMALSEISPADEPAPPDPLTADMEKLLQSLTREQAFLLCSIAARWMETVKAKADQE